MTSNTETHKKALFSRRRIIDLGYGTGRNGAHFGSSLSLVDIITIIYSIFFKAGVADSKSVDRNKFILISFISMGVTYKYFDFLIHLYFFDFFILSNALPRYD